MTFDIPSGSEFPDLVKAKLAKKLDGFIKGIVNEDKEFFQLAQDKKQKLRNQRTADIKSFIISQGGAIERGNSNACDSRHKHEQIGNKQRSQIKPNLIPVTKKKSPLQKGKIKKTMPKTRSVTPTKGSRSRPPSIARFKVNAAIAAAVSTIPHYIQPVDASNYPSKAKRNAEQFISAQQGNRGHSIGDRAIVFSANGTPHYGDTYLDKNGQENLAANQATSNAPIFQVPSRVQVGKPISANPLQQQPRANVAPKADTTGNIIALGAIGAAITAVLFLFQHVLIFVQMILQVSSVTSTITNIAGSFVAILNNIGSLFGLGEGLIDPLSKTFDSILNNTFGKEKVDYVKFQFAKISSAYVAAQNLASKMTNMQNSLGTVTADNANNTSKIGNALKAIGMLATGDGWMREDNKIAQGIGKLGESLSKVSGLSSSLSEITQDVKSFDLEQKQLAKTYQDQQKQTVASNSKAVEKHEDKSIADLPPPPESK